MKIKYSQIDFFQKYSESPLSAWLFVDTSSDRMLRLMLRLMKAFD